MFPLSSLSRGILRNIARHILSLSILGMIGLGCMMLTSQIYAAPFDSIGGGSLDTSFPGFQLAFDNEIYTLALQSDGKILAGGYFTAYNSVTASRLIRFNVDGTRDTTFTQTGTGLDNSVHSLALQSDGKILVGGNFTTYNGVAAPYLIRLNADGTRDASFVQTGTGLNNIVRSVFLQSDGKILVGGDFTTYNGVAAPYLIRLNADGTRDASFVQTGTGLNGSVHSLALQSDGKILAGGGFTAYNGVAKQGIIRLNADGSHDATFTQTGTGLLNPLVTTIVILSNGKILAGGGFTAYNGVAKQGIIRLNADGSHDATFNPGGAGTNSMVRTLILQSDGKILVGGDFTTYNGITESKMIRLNADGTKDTTFSKSEAVPDSSLYSLILQPDGKIIAGGRGVAAADLTRLNTDGTRDTNFQTGTGLNSTALSLVIQPDGKILVGGGFTNFNGISPKYVTRLNTDGTRDTNFQTGVGGNASVNTLALQPDGKILVGGTFTYFHGVSAKYLTRLNADGTRDASFAQTGTGLSAAVNTLALQSDGKILVGGTFTTYNGVAAPYLIRLNADGTRDASFAQTGTGLSAQVRALAIQPDGKILAGGNFTTYNSVTALRLIRLNVDGTRDTTLQGGAGLNGIVYNIALQSDGKILVGGTFTTYNGVAAPYLIRLNADGTRDASFAQTGTGLSAQVRALAIQPDSKILAGGTFTAYNGTPAAYLTRINGGTSFCSAVTDVPQVECEALKSIYYANSGSGWTRKTGWGTSTTVGSWSGVTVSGGHVTQLNLSANNISNTFSISTSGLSYLQYLNLSNNQLNDFNVVGLPGLTYLDISNNQLTSFPGVGLPTLETLDLNNNQLTSFDGTNLPTLHWLFLNSNQLTSFSGTGLADLQSLYINDNNLSTFNGSGINYLNELALDGNQLASFNLNSTDYPSITSLSLSGNQLTSFNSTNIPGLYSLNLSNNQLTSFSVTNFSSLGVLDLTGNQLTSFDGTGLNTLEMLSLGNNYIRKFLGIEDLDWLWWLTLSNNCLPPYILSPDITSWFGTLTQIDDWMIQNASCPAVTLCDYVTDVPLAECQGLMSLYTSTEGDNWTNSIAEDNMWGSSTRVNDWYGVDVWGGHVVGIGLASNNLHWNFAITEGSLPYLTQLDLSWNGLSSFQGTGLPGLVGLGLSNNQLTSFNGVGLSSLTTLALYGNQLTSFSSTGLSGLTDLSLSDNNITSFSGIGSPNLASLDLSGNQLTSFNSTGLTALQDLILTSNLISSFSNTILNITALQQGDEDDDFSNNCLDRSSLSPSIANWLDTYSTFDWTTRNSSCPALPSTMYFCGNYITDPTNWYQPDNWSGDATCQSSAPKLRPDAADNVIILANVAKNEVSPSTPAPKATVKTLQVLEDSVVSIPIRNGGGYTYMTNLAGDNNDIIWTSSDLAVTITYATPVPQPQTNVSVSGKNIIVTPGLSGAPFLDTNWFWSGILPMNSQLHFEKIGNGNTPSIQFEKIYTGSNSVTVVGDTIKISLRNALSNSADTVKNLIESSPQASALVSVSCMGDGSCNGMITPTIDNIDFGPTALFAGGLPTAQSVLDAVNNDPQAILLISGTLAPNNDGTGAVTDMPTTTISAPATTYATPMSFLGTSINAEFDTSTPAAIAAKTKNTLTGDAVFACTAQNLGIVTGNTTFTQCDATTAPTTTSLSTNNTPTFTGLCAPNTLVTLYNGTTALTPSVLCSIGGTYSITPTLSPGNYAITVKQSNRKGPTFGTSNASSPVLNHVIGCPEGQDWNGIACASTCTTTEAPTELKANIDKPYISCTDSNQGAQFKYRISDPNNPAFTPIVSGAYSTGSRALYDGVLSENIANNSTQHGSLDTTFSPTGANNLIWGMSRQSDEKIIIGGGFTSYNGTSRNRIARLNADGSLDTTFDPGTGANDYVEKTMLQSNGKIIIIGFFTTYNGTSRNRIARLNADGSLDTTFDPGTGANDRITAVRIQSDGKIVIGGKFTTYNGTSRNRIARLNADGSLDTTFDPGTGFTDINTEISTIFQQSNGNLLVGGRLYAYNGSSRNGIVRIQGNGMIDSSFTLGTGFLQSVRYITQQPDGKIIIGGWFTSYGGVTRNRIARLNADGSLDTTFDPGVGAAGGEILVILQQPDGKIIIGGWFTSYGGVTRNRIARINLDGTLDTTFDPGSGANNVVYDVFQQPDGKIIIGGWFTSYNGVTRNSIARINAGGIPMGYKVECLYSNDNYATADSCTKTMVVRESTAGNEVQGCDRITNSFENFVGYEKWIHNAGFNASVSCFARKADPEITDSEIPPFLLQYGSDFTPLAYLNSFIDIGRFTSEVDVHTFDSSLNTATTCAVRVGDGYSTNSLCQNLGCGGAECDAPSQYLIQPAANNLYCTREANAEYSIGCAPGDSYAGCIRNDIVGNLYHGLTLQTGGEYDGKYTKTWKFRLDADTTSPDTIRTIVCNSATPQTNENTALNCTVSLPTGRELGMLVATDPIDQYQVVRDIIPRDTEPPIAIIKEADDRTIISSGGKRLTAVNNQWLNKPVTVTITCQNEAVENNDTCTCSWLYQYEIVDGNSTPPDSPSSSFMPYVPLRDIVDYKRVILGGEILNQLHVFFSDNANNSDQDLGVDISLGADTRYPSVSLQTEAPVSGAGNENKRRITLQATDNIGGSGLWGYGIRSVVINESGNINAVFDTECNLNTSLPDGTVANTSLPDINPVYAPFPETGDGFGPKSYGSVEYDITSQKIAYCVQDNAKNRLVGVYPFDPNMLIGCFSDGSQQFVPNLDIDNVDSRYYASLGNPLSLISRLTGGNPKYGYELTDPDKATSMADFRTKLAQNIETLVKQQYCPTTKNLANIVVNLEEKASTESPLQYAAKVKTEAGCENSDTNTNLPRNTRGYYYFKGTGANDVVDVAGVVRLTGTKVLIVEGADIYLGDNIHYLSRESSLTIIAIRSGGNGGNVYVDPKVTNIDATIIADGALMNGVPAGSDIDKKVWFNETDAIELQNPLVINGRLLTYNTRGGSLVANGNALETINLAPSSESGKCFINNIIDNTCLNTTAATQDLERFRVLMRVPDELGNRCTLHVTGVSALNRPEILTRSGF